MAVQGFFSVGSAPLSGTIFVNGRFEGRRITGVERYASEIVKRLGKRIRLIRPAHPQTGVRGHLWEQLVLPFYVPPKDLLWSPANSGPVTISNQVLTIQDLSPLEHPEWFVPAYGLWYQVLIPILARRVKCVLTSSLYVRRKVMHRFSLDAGQVVAVSAGVDQHTFQPVDPDLIRRSYPLGERYILFIGTLQQRKNLNSLLEAWRMICDEYPDTSLVIAGTPGRVFRQIKLSPETVNVIFLGYVPDQDLPALYAGAAIFILPSLDEGFGLTVLEAMACGTPVVISRAGALPEVAGDAAVQVAPDSPLDIAAALRTLLSSEETCIQLRQKGLERAAQFSWERSAREIWELLSKNA